MATVNAADPVYKAEIVPASIRAIAASLRAKYGRPADAFGDKGNLSHFGGYHRSRAWCLKNKPQDYSIVKADDRAGDPNWICACDFTPGEWGTAANRRIMAEITSRVYAAAKARDPRLANLREFAGTLDGRTVITFRCSDGALLNPFDPSHLDHIHGSFIRERAGLDHSGFIAVLLGQGGSMATIDEVAAKLDRALNGFTDQGKPTANLVGTWVSENQQAQKRIEATLAQIQDVVGHPYHSDGQAPAFDPAALKAEILTELRASLPTAEDIVAALLARVAQSS